MRTRGFFRTLERITRPPRQQLGDVDAEHDQHHSSKLQPGARYYQKGGYRELCDDGMWEWHDNDGAEQLTEREAEEEVSEPRVECPHGGDCPRECDRTQPGCVNIWGSDAEHAEAVERNAHEPCRPGCLNAGWAHIHADRGTGAINDGEPQQVTLSGREYERYLDGALNKPAEEEVPTYYCGALRDHPDLPYACTKPRGHDDAHGHKGVYWLDSKSWISDTTWQDLHNATGECTRACSEQHTYEAGCELAAEEEVSEPRRRMHCVFCDGVFPDGCTCGDEPTEPALTDDELVAVRQLIEERFPLHTIFAGAAASLAGVPDGADYINPSVREDKQQDAADPHLDVSSVGDYAGEVSDNPQSPSLASPAWVDWATPAICTVLHEHQPYKYNEDGLFWCLNSDGYNHAPHGDWDWQAWLEHVAPLIAERLERAARTEK